MVIALPIVGRAGQGEPTRTRPRQGKRREGEAEAGRYRRRPRSAPDRGSDAPLRAEHADRVSVVTKGLVRPWRPLNLPERGHASHRAAGPVAESCATGSSIPAPISGLPQEMFVVYLAGLMDIALHPQFADNHLVYFTYPKSGEKGGTHPGARTSGRERARRSPRALRVRRVGDRRRR